MKSFLLTAIALMASAGSMFAQNLPPVYSWEIGVNGGYSAITRPLGPAEGYQGKSTNIVSDFSIRASYFFNEHWMISGDIGSRKWETFGQLEVNDKFNTKLAPASVNYLIADRAISSIVMMNYVIPFYTQFQTYNKANLYFGVNGGMINTVNDGSRGYTTVKSPIDSGSVTYMSSYHYGSGVGYTFGLQTGFTYNIVPRLGVNIELGLRYASVATNSQGAQSGNARYHLLYFPETIGIRWRF